VGRPSTSLAAVRRRLLADPSLIDVGAAAVRVMAKRDGCSVKAAEDSLHGLREHMAVNRVFKEVMPAEYARQKGSVEERRYEFFRLINERFPVDWHYLNEAYGMDVEDGEDAFGPEAFFHYGIMIHSLRPCNSWDLSHDWHAVTLAYQLADVLFLQQLPAGREVPWGSDQKWQHLAKRGLADEGFKLVDDEDRPAIRRAFVDARGPMKYLADAYKVLVYDTGSVFFDYDPEDGIEPFDWTQPAVEFLTGQYRLARGIERRIAKLETWLDADPAGRTRQILNYYAKHRRALRREQSIRVRVGAPSRALVDLL
jgi:hypothetical protein